MNTNKVYEVLCEEEILYTTTSAKEAFEVAEKEVARLRSIGYRGLASLVNLRFRDEIK